MRHEFGFFKIIGSVALIFVALWGAVAGGVILDRLILARFVPLSNIQPAAEPDFKLIAEAWNIISKEFVDHQAAQPRKLTHGAIGGMVDALGDTGHSTFLTPDMLKLERNYVEGNFSGIGAQVRMKDGHVVILAPLEGSPAQKAGLQSGDIIMKVNGEEISSLSLDQAVVKITGKPGTKVTLTVLSPKSEQTREVTLVRAVITVHNVTWVHIPGTNLADVRIAGFSQGVAGELRDILGKVRQAGFSGMLLDLRDNPGGVFDEAVDTVSQFLKSGAVALVKNSKGEITEVPVRPDGRTTDIRLIVLINAGSASASEIVSGALQDAHRASLVGEKTFGTGTVLQTFRLSDGSAILLAIAEWLTPAGRVIWHQGIVPDTAVPLPAGVTPLYPEKIKGMSEAQFRESGDVQILKAVDLLQNVDAVEPSPVRSEKK